MSESKKHMDLVRRLKEYIEKLPNIENGLIQSDLPETSEKPILTTEGFRPDIYYEYLDTMVIGEAKTTFDFERQHSLEQYESYLRRCSLYWGKATFILAVPWMEYTSAKNLIRRIKKRNNYDIETLIMNDSDRVEKV